MAQKTKTLFITIMASLFFNNNTQAQEVIPISPMPIKVVRLKERKDAIAVYNFNSTLMQKPLHIYQLWSSKNSDTLYYKTVSKLWYNRRVTLKVVINPYLYNVKISSRQANEGGLIDTMEMRLFTTALLSYKEKKEAIDTAKKNISEASKTAEPKAGKELGKTLSEGLAVSDADKRVIKNAIQPATDAITVAENFNSTGVLPTSTAALSPAVQNRVREEIEEISDEYEMYKDFIAAQQNFRKKNYHFYEKTKQLQSFFDVCENITIKCLQDKLSAKEIRDALSDYLRIERYQGYDTMRLYLGADLWNKKDSMDDAFQDMQLAFNQMKPTVFTSKYFKGVNIEVDSILKSNSDTLYSLVNKLKTVEMSKGLISMMDNFTNPESFVFTDPSTLLVKDTIVYHIETTPSTKFATLLSMYNIKTHASKFDILIPVKGNFKLNFSVGAAFMFSELKAKNYNFSTPLENLPSDSSLVKLIEKPGADNFVPALAAYVHGYIKLGGWFTPAITAGLSTNPTDFSNASYFLGGSIIFGHQSRLIFTFGRAASSINVLKPKYEIDKAYIKKDLLNVQEADLVKKGFKTGWFFGVSYNVSSNR